MINFIKTLIKIIINYNIYFFPILLNEIEFYFRYDGNYNKIKHFDNNISADPIPSSFFIIKKIDDFVIQKDIKKICDLGAGFGKTLYFFGKVKNYKIDGVELNKNIFNETLSLKSENIDIFNENILNFDLMKKKYDLFIINDPLKKEDDFKKLINNINTINHKMYFVFINLNVDKVEITLNNFKIIDKKIFSKNRNILFCSN